MNESNIKKILLEKCKNELESEIDILKKAINDAQFEANQHKGAMESRYDTFKEEAQARKSGFELQLFKKYKILNLLKSIHENSICKNVGVGAIVETSKDNYFIS
ncbi:hypothetical protein ACFLZD_02840, partial [Candidatus Neomarinimicrobiota bacterium]